MKAVGFFPEHRSVRIVDHPPPPRPQETEVRIRILEVGVCGTDREIARGEYGAGPPGSPYLVLGHESLGEVVEVGAKVTGLRPGDLAVTMVRRPCGDPACPACAVGRPDFCVTGKFTERGIKGRHGFMTEEIVDDQRYVVVLPRSLRSVGVLLEPLTIAEKALIELGDVVDRLPWRRDGAARPAGHASETAVVLGAGPVGLLGAMALLLRGYRTCIYSREPADSAEGAWARSVGAEYVCGRDVPLPELPGRLGRNVDLVYEATGSAELAFQALPILGVNGLFILTGVPAQKHPIEVDADDVMRGLVLKNQLVYGTVNAGRDAFETGVADLIELHRRWPGPLAGLVTGRSSPEACHEVLLGARSGIKQVISFAA
jgi:threonine dehydrogenase-like Zn-dependent dehydrogenase